LDPPKKRTLLVAPGTHLYDDGRFATPDVLRCGLLCIVVLKIRSRAQPLIAVSPFFSAAFAAEIQRTLLHLQDFISMPLLLNPYLNHMYRISTWPNVPVLLPSMNSSVPASWMFMYESMETRRPLYSV
jgi:hypothetical protein